MQTIAGKLTWLFFTLLFNLLCIFLGRKGQQIAQRMLNQ
jgi:hypothetical protein